MERATILEVRLSPEEVESLRRLAEELATTPTDALRQLAAHGRQGWPWQLLRASQSLTSAYMHDGGTHDAHAVM